MKEKHKIEIDELLNDLVDGQATERQETEFKRLAIHDPSIIDRLEALRQQKQLLNALPVESAPASMAEDIRAALERKLILGEYSESKQSIAGTSHLFLRRILTTAAMLLLPLGLLSFVVYEIIKPASVGPAFYVSTDKTLAQENQDNSSAVTSSAINKALPFDGVLTFETDRQMAVTNYIEKVVFDQGLNSFPTRTADMATYQITASPSQIANLAHLLNNVWPYCQSVTLNVIDELPSRTFEIPSVQAEQIASLANTENPGVLSHLAGQYAIANKNKETLFAKESPSELQDIDLNVYPPRLRMPILTGRSDSTKSQSTDSDQPTVQLRIQVKRVTE